MKNQKIKIPIGDNFIVTEAYQADPEFPIEITTYLEDKNGNIFQDICLVREFYAYDKKTNEMVFDKNKISCMVWQDCNDENITDALIINIRKDEE